MKCEEAGNLFSEFISGDIESALTVSLENHLAACSDCRQAVCALRTVWAELDEMGTVEPPAFFHENLMSRIHEAELAREQAENRARFDWRALFRPRALAYAASAAVLLMAGVGGLHYTKAALDPVGAVIHLLHPTQAHTVELSTSRAEWSPNAQGTGSIIVYLKAQPEADGKTSTLNCMVNIPADYLAIGAKTDMAVTSDSEGSISIPVKALPNSISVTISSADPSVPGASKTEPITLMHPVEQR